jgi:hypothetical protein
MFLFAAGINSSRGSGIPDPQRDPGKGRKDKNFGIREFHYPREAAEARQKPSVRRTNNDFREAGFDLQTQRNFAKGSESES